MRRSMLVLLLAVALVGGACGGGDKKGSSALQHVLASAPDKTLAEGTSKVAINVALTGSQADTSFAGDGEFDFKNQRGRLNLDLSSLGVQGGEASEIRFSGDVVFMKLALPIPQLKERPWLKIDIASLGQQSGINLDSLRQFQSNDPTAALNYLRGVTDDVTEVGREQVRGDATTRYKATLDLDKAARSVPSGVKDDIRQIIRQLGTSRIPTEAWLDEQGRLRRLRYSIDLSTLEGSPANAGTLTASFELYEFGVAVDVPDPASNEVTDLAELLGSTTTRK